MRSSGPPLHHSAIPLDPISLIFSPLRHHLALSPPKNHAFSDGHELADVGAFMLMCTNNPDWVEWEIAYGKRGIDNGADMILVDTPMGASFVSGGFLKGGFCKSCMDRFTKHMTDTFTPDEMLERFGIKALEVPDLIKRLSSRQIVGPPELPTRLP